MGEAQRGRTVQQGSAVHRGKGRAVSGGLAMTTAAVAAIGLLAGCQSAGASPAGAAAAGTSRAGTTPSDLPQSYTVTAWPTPEDSSPPPSTTAVSSGFVPTVEPFDPGHQARPVKAPADCGSQDSTLAIEQCYEGKTETADAAIDTLRKAAFDQGSPAQRAAINSADHAWLAARGPVCAKAYRSGGTIDGVNVAACLLDESSARLHALRGDQVSEAVLKSTDSANPADLSWFTTPAGSRIAMSDTQGDASGGVIVSWVIIAGSAGYTVNPADFAYLDGSFTDQGKVQGASPRGHRVAPGTEFTFSVDYSRLKADQNRGPGAWVYSPGTPAAAWR